MTVSEWLETNRHRLHGEGEEWVTKRVAVLEVPGRTLTLGLEPVLSRVIEDPPERDLEARKLEARRLIA